MSANPYLMLEAYPLSSAARYFRLCFDISRKYWLLLPAMPWSPFWCCYLVQIHPIYSEPSRSCALPACLLFQHASVSCARSIQVARVLARQLVGPLSWPLIQRPGEPFRDNVDTKRLAVALETLLATDFENNTAKVLHVLDLPLEEKGIPACRPRSSSRTPQPHARPRSCE